VVRVGAALMTRLNGIVTEVGLVVLPTVTVRLPL